MEPKACDTERIWGGGSKISFYELGSLYEVAMRVKTRETAWLHSSSHGYY